MTITEALHVPHAMELVLMILKETNMVSFTEVYQHVHGSYTINYTIGYKNHICVDREAVYNMSASDTSDEYNKLEDLIKNDIMLDIVHKSTRINDPLRAVLTELIERTS